MSRIAIQTGASKQTKQGGDRRLMFVGLAKTGNFVKGLPEIYSLPTHDV